MTDAECELIETLSDRQWEVVIAIPPDDNYRGVMLVHHVAAPYPMRDLFLHLAEQDDAAHVAGMAQLAPEWRPPIRAQGPTLLSALQAAVILDDARS